MEKIVSPILIIGDENDRTLCYIMETINLIENQQSSKKKCIFNLSKLDKWKELYDCFPKNCIQNLNYEKIRKRKISNESNYIYLFKICDGDEWDNIFTMINLNSASYIEFIIYTPLVFMICGRNEFYSNLNRFFTKICIDKSGVFNQIGTDYSGLEIKQIKDNFNDTTWKILLKRDFNSILFKLSFLLKFHSCEKSISNNLINTSFFQDYLHLYWILLKYFPKDIIQFHILQEKKIYLSFSLKSFPNNLENFDFKDPFRLSQS
jgi:hypothetical protein